MAFIIYLEVPKSKAICQAKQRVLHYLPEFAACRPGHSELLCPSRQNIISSSLKLTLLHCFDIQHIIIFLTTRSI